MSYAGTVLDMISRIKYNESLRPSRNYKFQNVREAYLKEIKRNNIRYIRDIDLTAEEMAEIKANIRKKLKRDYYSRIFKTTATAIFFFTVLSYLIYISMGRFGKITL